jgi:hypothetical protein
VRTEEQKAQKRVRMAAWRKANSEKVNARQAAWRKANAKKERARKAVWYKANPEKVKAKNAAYYKANPEKVKAKNRRARQHANLCQLQTTIAAMQKVAATAQKQISAQIQK